ncbi:hypothetical protein JCM11251_002490 [Rhodosporidiobolus azoricus]
MSGPVDKNVKVQPEMQEISHNERAPARFAVDEDPTNSGTRFTDGDSLAATTTTDTEKAGSSKYASSTIGIEHAKASKAEERRLVRKLDVVILPLAIFLYLAAYLDRGAMGNAKLLGLYDSVLGGVDTRYSIALCCFYITYILLSVPGTLLAKAVMPSTSIALGALIWSIATSCQAGVMNPAGLYVSRLAIGVGEALFGQAMALYFTFWYRKGELAKRIGLFISAGSLAGAFSGLIAYGVARIDNAALERWRILFLIEGLPSFVLAVVVFFCLPSRPDKSRYLTPEERTLACTRLNADSLGETHSGIDWKAVRYALRDWKTYILALAYSAMNLGLGSVSGFLPTIIKGLGYSNADAQLYSVPPYAVALVVMLLVTSYSDRYQTRGIPAACVFMIGIVGWALLLGIDPVGVSAGGLRARYFACCCIVTAGYANIPILMAWTSNNAASESQRAVQLGTLNSVGQCLSILASFSFPSTEGPKFLRGAGLNIGFSSLGLLISLAMTLYFRLENRKRDQREGGRPPKGIRIEGLMEDYDKAVEAELYLHGLLKSLAPFDFAPTSQYPTVVTFVRIDHQILRLSSAISARAFGKMAAGETAPVAVQTPAAPAPSTSNGAGESNEQQRPQSPSLPPSSTAHTLPVASSSASSAAPKRVVLLRRPACPPSAPASPDSPSLASGPADKAGENGLSEGLEQLAISEEHSGAAAGSEEDGRPALDPVVLAALSHPRDRFLLLRAEVELERFVGSASSTRLPLAPPHFPPALNSYQRLLVHRLADIFGITREVEAASSLWNSGPVINPATGQPQGVVVLVKGEATKLPPAKLATYVPAPASVPPTVPVIAPPPASTITSSSPAASAVSSPAASIDPALSTSSASPSPATPEPQRIFKILPRAAASHTTSSASSSAGDDDSIALSGSGKGKGRHELTLEEREAAYKEARERIFAQPDPERPPLPVPGASTVSSGASELGMGITRPSSAGSTFSRSSAAMSISGARPSPSLASESSSSIRSGYTGYYAAPPPPMQYGVAPGYPNLRSSAPIFDPASGGWTYPQQQQQQPDNGYGGAGYSAGDYGRTPPGSQPYFPSYQATASMQPAYPGQPQPPIQVTAPSPHSQAASYAYGASAAPSFAPSAYPQQTPYDPSPTWSQPSHRTLSSPALSASSGMSMQHHHQHHAQQYQQQQQQQQPHVGTASNASGSSSAGGSGGAGYLMRFSDGSVVTPGGSITTPSAASGSATRSVDSLSSASISSLNSSARAGMPRSMAPSGGGRRLSASTTHSVGSVSAISSAALDDSSSSVARKSPPASTSLSDSAASSSKAPSEAGSSSAGGLSSEGKRRDRQTTIVGGRHAQESVKGKGKERAAETEEGQAQDDGKASLHPSLPSKPAWVANQPPQIRDTHSAGAGSSTSTVPPAVPTSATLPPPLSFSPQPPHSRPSFPSYAAPASSSGIQSPQAFFPPAQVPPPDLGGPSVWGAPPSAPPSSYALAPSDFPALGGTGGAAPPPPQPFYPSQLRSLPPPAPYPYGNGAPPAPPSAWAPSPHPSLAAIGPQPTQFHPSIPLQQQQARAFPPAPPLKEQDLMNTPDMRRPPPRSTQLFDPTKPVGAGPGRGTGRK